MTQWVLGQESQTIRKWESEPILEKKGPAKVLGGNGVTLEGRK